MGDERAAVGGYLSRLVSGLVACAVGSVMLHADVAAAAILATIMLLVLAAMCVVLRGRAL